MGLVSKTLSLFDRQQYNTYCPKTNISMNIPDYIEKNGLEYLGAAKYLLVFSKVYEKKP